MPVKPVIVVDRVVPPLTVFAGVVQVVGAVVPKHTPYPVTGLPSVVGDFVQLRITDPEPGAPAVAEVSVTGSAYVYFGVAVTAFDTADPPTVLYATTTT